MVRDPESKWLSRRSVDNGGLCQTAPGNEARRLRGGLTRISMASSGAAIPSMEQCRSDRDTGLVLRV